MQSTRPALALVLVAGALLALVGGCDQLRRTPVLTPTPTAVAQVPPVVVAARDQVLSYIRGAYANKAPTESVHWTAHSTAPADLTGVSSHEFTGDGWLLTLSIAIVSGEKSIYEAGLVNRDAGFSWTGKLDSDYAVLESNLDVAREVLVVRDIVLSHVRERYSDEAPAGGLAWSGERTTAEGSVGHESCHFAAEEWTLAVEYDVGRPDQVVYLVVLESSDGFTWRGQVDAERTVHELRPGS